MKAKKGFSEFDLDIKVSNFMAIFLAFICQKYLRNKASMKNTLRQKIL